MMMDKPRGWKQSSSSLRRFRRLLHSLEPAAANRHCCFYHHHHRRRRHRHRHHQQHNCRIRTTATTALRTIIIIILLSLLLTSATAEATDAAGAVEGEGNNNQKLKGKKILADEMRQSLLTRLPSIFLNEFEIVTSLDDLANNNEEDEDQEEEEDSKRKKTGNKKQNILWVLEEEEDCNAATTATSSSSSSSSYLLFDHYYERLVDHIVFVSHAQRQRYEQQAIMRRRRIAEEESSSNNNEEQQQQQQQQQEASVAAKVQKLIETKSTVLPLAVEPLLQLRPLKQSKQQQQQQQQKPLRIVYMQTSTTPYIALQRMVLPAFIETLHPRHGSKVQLDVFILDNTDTATTTANSSPAKAGAAADILKRCNDHVACRTHNNVVRPSRKGVHERNNINRLTVRTILKHAADILIIPKQQQEQEQSAAAAAGGGGREENKEHAPLLASVVLEAMGAGVEVVHYANAGGSDSGGDSGGTLQELLQPGMGVPYHHPSSSSDSTEQPQQQQQRQRQQQESAALENFAKSIDEAVVTYAHPLSAERRRKCQLWVSNSYTWGIYGSGSGRIEEWARLLTSLLPQEPKYLEPAKSHFVDDKDDNDRAYSEALFAAARRAEVTEGNLQRAFEMYRACVALEEERSRKVTNVKEINFVSTLALANLAYLGGQRFNTPPMVESAIQQFTVMLRTADQQPNSPLESSFSNEYYEMARKVALHHLVRFEYEPARVWFDQLHLSKTVHDDCSDLTRATMVPHLPHTAEEHDANMKQFHANIDELLDDDRPVFCMNALSSMYMGFPMAYYDLNFREPQEKWVQLFRKAVPQANYWSPNLRWSEEKVVIQPREHNVRAPLKIGVVGSNLKKDHSNWGSFGPTLNYLQRNRPDLQIDFIHYTNGEPMSPEDKLLSANPETNIYLEDLQNGIAGPNLMRYRQMIEERKYDLLLYIDFWLVPEMFYMGAAKLAPIQLNTYGHPTTSGLPRSIMDYYLSWGMAEQENRTVAQGFYTEELYTIGNTTPWEIFERRTHDNGTSIVGMPFGHYTKTNLDFYPSEEARQKMTKEGVTWYFCSQNLFKFGVPFDKVLGRIQKKDPNALIILVSMTKESQYERLDPIAVKRISNAHGGVDMNRVVFIPRMSHGHLMAMYNLSDVVLDPYYFGGCTTSREALEVGAPIVNLPHRTVGQRFTQAYQRTIGMTDLIAQDLDDYVRIAVKVANMKPNEKAVLREKIRTSALEKLFDRDDAGELWGDAFIDIANRPRNWRWVDEKEEVYSPTGGSEVKTEL